MTPRSPDALLAIALLAMTPALTSLSGQASSTRSFSEHFVEANGIKLHYLDWGGRGDPVVFLTGFGTPAATFDDLAVGLRDRFHVYALTRRGLPPSATPAAGYELAWPGSR